MTRREESDEKYILDLAAEVLAEPDYRWQHRFPTLLGDPDADGRRRPLPVDGYFPRHRLVLEYWERQHSSPVAIMDDGMTVSGISRGHQRRAYDTRRRVWAEANGLRFVILDHRGFEEDQRGRLLRCPDRDRQIIASALRAAGVLAGPARLAVGGTPNEGQAQGGCLFCRLAQGDATAPANALVWRDKVSIAFLPRLPAVYGHVVVATLAHRSQMTDELTLHEYLSLQRVVYAVALAVRSYLSSGGVHILSLASQQAGAHLHWHVLPLQPGQALEPQHLASLDDEEREAVQLTAEEGEALAASLRARFPAWMREREPSAEGAHPGAPRS